MPDVIRWLATYLSDPDGDSEDIDQLRQLARFRRSQSYKISEVLDELTIFDDLLFGRARRVGEESARPAAPGEIVAVTARLHEGLERLRSVLVGTFEEEAEHHARELRARVDTYVRTLSHELKNPLGAAARGAEMLQEDEIRADPSSLAKFTELIIRNLGRAQTLIADLRMLIVASEADSEASPPTPLRQVVDDVCQEVQTAAGERGVKLEFQDPLPDVLVDARRLTLVLMNLVWNSVRYSDPAKDTRWTRITVEPESEGWWKLSFADNGLGIPKEAQGRIFERFFRAHPHVKGGTGLGLPIVAEAVEQLGGHIGLESAPGEGTTFFVTFPETGITDKQTADSTILA